MVGWFRDQSRSGFDNAQNDQDFNRFMTEKAEGAPGKAMISGDRLRSPAGNSVNDKWDGQFAIATLPGDGAEVTYLATYPSSDGSEIWQPFSKDGRLLNPLIVRMRSSTFTVRFIVAPHEKRLIPMALSWDLPVVKVRWRPVVRIGAVRDPILWSKVPCLANRPHRPRAS